MEEAIIVFVTCGSEEEASKISNSLIEKRLAACANIISPIRSIYRWEGKIWDEKEYLIIIKTKRSNFEELEKEIKSLHSYSVPEVVALRISEGSIPYLNWIFESTKPE